MNSWLIENACNIKYESLLRGTQKKAAGICPGRSYAIYAALLGLMRAMTACSLVAAFFTMPFAALLTRSGVLAAGAISGRAISLRAGSKQREHGNGKKCFKHNNVFQIK
jgi:hypothetical protein